LVRNAGVDVAEADEVEADARLIHAIEAVETLAEHVEFDVPVRQEVHAQAEAAAESGIGLAVLVVDDA
jgi:hypothetical protein